MMKRVVLGVIFAASLNAIPFYARKFNKSCVECHVGYSKLNVYGEVFKDNLYLTENYNPRLQTMELEGDKRIYLPRELPISARVRVMMGLLVDSASKTKGFSSSEGEILASSNLSSNSSFFLALSNRGIRDAFVRLNLPFKSKFMLGKMDLSEFFFKRYQRLTYADFLVYDSLNGEGFAVSISPYITLGNIRVLEDMWFGRVGFSSNILSFGISAFPRDYRQRYLSEVRMRFWFFDVFSTTMLAFDQRLGEFKTDTSSPWFVSGHAGLDMIVSYNFFFSILYRFSETTFKDYEQRIERFIAFAFGGYPLRNLKTGLEFGYETNRREGYGGVSLEWTF